MDAARCIGEIARVCWCELWTHQLDRNDRHLAFRAPGSCLQAAETEPICRLNFDQSPTVVNVRLIHRLKLRHSNLWQQYNLYVARQHGVLTEVKW